MTEDELIQRLLDAGFHDRASAAAAVRATISAFVRCLTPEEAGAFARSVDGLLDAGASRGGSAGADRPGAEDMYELVRRSENVAAGAAREHAQIVLGAIGERLDPALRLRLVGRLPADLARLLEARDIGAPPDHVPPSFLPPLHTLASGRPGSRHPISEARPERAQSHSVVKEDNPHGETKLSSSRGTTQERLGDSLATGHPGPTRPISQVHDDAHDEEEER